MGWCNGHQMDQATQKNAALVEEVAAAASSLKNQANELVDIVAIFKWDGDPLQARADTPAAGASRVKAVFAAPTAALPRLALASRQRA